MDNVVEFRRLAQESVQGQYRRPTRRRSRRSMQTFVFRSYELIVESSETDLVRDVRLDVHKAQVKLRKIKERLRGVQEQAAAQVQLLTAAQTKLSAAIVVALLSKHGKE